jgi:hypothetical protein
MYSGKLLSLQRVHSLAHYSSLHFCVRDGVLGFAVTSLFTSPLLVAMARAHAHSSTVMWDTLSSLRCVGA